MWQAKSVATTRTYLPRVWETQGTGRGWGYRAWWQQSRYGRQASWTQARIAGERSGEGILRASLRAVRYLHFSIKVWWVQKNTEVGWSRGPRAQHKIHPSIIFNKSWIQRAPSGVTKEKFYSGWSQPVFALELLMPREDGQTRKAVSCYPWWSRAGEVALVSYLTEEGVLWQGNDSSLLSM